jgi:imidazolonepropionase-like amidohydrolase
MLLTAARLFDGDATTIAQPWLRLRGERIEALGSFYNGPPPPLDEGEDRLDFPEATVLPGLIDTHVHLVFSALATNADIVAQVTRESDDELIHRALANVRAALYAGITTVRDCGGRGELVQRVRDTLRRGEAKGADVLACGAPITTANGHCHWLGLIADGEAAALAAAERMLTQGADFLKVMATGGNMTPSSDPMIPQYDARTLTGIADLGRSAGKHTAAHVLSRSAIPHAVAARVRTIEHCDWRVEVERYEFDESLAQTMIEQGQFAGLTMSGLTRRALVPDDGSDVPALLKRLDARFACERRMIDSGVRFTLHSDAGVRRTPIDTLALGLRAAVHELRLTPAEAIRAATATAAEAIGLPDRGRLAPGLRADMLVVAGNPLTDMSALEKVRAVMQAGRLVELPSRALVDAEQATLRIADSHRS